MTTILKKTDSLQEQAFWKKWRSDPENLQHSEQAMNRGSLFHAIAENHFKKDNGSNPSQQTDNAITDKITEPFWKSVQAVLPRITDIQLIESAVWHEVGCYAGTVDMVASFDGTPCILDWKTSAKPKSSQWRGHYPLQLAAYCGAVNRMYGAKINHGVIIVALPDAPAQVFQYPLGGYHWQSWLNRLTKYWQKQATPQAKLVLESLSKEYR